MEQKTKNRSEVVAELTRVNKLQTELRKRLDEIDADFRTAEALAYVGRCFNDGNTRGDYKRCVYVYEVCPVNHVPVSIDIALYGEDSFHVDGRSTYFPCEMTEWVEVKRSEFEKVYKKAIELMELAQIKKISRWNKKHLKKRAG